MLENQDSIIDNEILSDTTKRYLNETSKWTKLIAIVSIVYIGILVLSLFTLSAVTYSEAALTPFAGLGMGYMVFMYSIMIAVMIYPIYCLFLFSKNVKLGNATSSNSYFEEAIRHIKNFFKFYGIITAIAIGLVALAVIFGAIGAAFA